MKTISIQTINRITKLNDKFFLVQQKNNTYNIINKNMELILPNDANNVISCYRDNLFKNILILVYREKECYKHVIFDLKKGCQIGIIFNNCYIEHDYPYIIITLNGKWNALDTKGNLILNEWVDEISFYNKKLFSVSHNNKHNLFSIKTKQFIFEKWSDSPIYVHFNKFYCFKINGKIHFIDKQTNKELDFICEEIEPCSDYISSVKINDKWMLFDERVKKIIPNLILDEEADVDLHNNRLLRITINGRKNLYDCENNKIIFNNGFRHIFHSYWTSGDFKEDSFCVLNNDRKQNKVSSKTFEILSPIWFDDYLETSINARKRGLLIITLDKKCNILDEKNKRLLFDTWVDQVISIEENTALVLIEDIIKEVNI